MQSWYHIIPKNTGLSTYVWIIFCLLPFFFIFRSSSMYEIAFGIFMTLLFFLSYRLSFISNSRMVYLWVSIEMAISLVMTFLFGYIYFALFLAFFIGNIKHLGGFLSLYIVHLTTTVAAVTLTFVTEVEDIFPHLPFIVITVIGVILLPFTVRYRNKQHKLEGELQDANDRISQLMVLEERERIARDLHDTLGQKLSMIGLKSDLAGKLIPVKPEKAVEEVQDIRQTARTALKEVREMVSDMRGTKLEDELIRVQQIIEAAEMSFEYEGSPNLENTPLLVENVLSMCLKEAATNIVKHSHASHCKVTITQTSTEILVVVEDNGHGLPDNIEPFKGNGMQGMRERLEFVNGSLEIYSSHGTTLRLHVPNIIKQSNKEESV
ncbi:sensor histidine kinase [Halobacillus halophilus]|uniref:histidine kinase n=1 Tax=Halobacillus halophilus (strain ATCC 35676 / DSM 2266 / JCM 20832 / KCTC 3685 / LMG 17431 / NBRC 102448 / NCIMB 2269) TaxID=866895 RepID=I0JT77_HALH3|nr:sensor histidine kinase [Halobacillus halophilus]ASF41265.1 sensor histidine kinase [Halobacillus halophilus]CCG47349.1 two-component sensor histidine kinase [Halobacillus halophilus DSM 2266]